MKKIAIAFLAAASLASFGCKKKGGSGETTAAMAKYKTELCACKDHDMECGKKATDAYQKALADLNAKNTEKADTSAKPDPELEKLTNEVSECSKRVMMPDPAAAGAAGGAAAGSAAGSAAEGSAAAPAAGGSADGSAAGSAAPAAGGSAAEGSAAGSAAK